jgi:hypothetical protein
MGNANHGNAQASRIFLRVDVEDAAHRPGTRRDAIFLARFALKLLPDAAARPHT